MRAQRTKIGVILPSSNTTVEADFQRVVPPETSIHSARMWAVGSSVEVLEEMNHDLDQCAKHLGSAAVDIIAYACTGGSILGGVGFDRKVKQCISEVAGGIPAVPTATAVVEALRSLKIQKVSVVTPYPDDINESLRAFLEGSGFEVLGLFGRGHTLNLDIGADTPETILSFAKQYLNPEADGMFLSCTNWAAMGVAEKLEMEIGKPVVTSNQATIWAAFCALGMDQPITGYGRLMASP